jgi:hypothetical protein
MINGFSNVLRSAIKYMKRKMSSVLCGKAHVDWINEVRAMEAQL